MLVVPVLTEEHYDGRIWADMDNDLWQRHPVIPGVWLVTSQKPFIIAAEAFLEASEAFGPYRLVGYAES